MGREQYLVRLERRDREPVLEGYNPVKADHPFCGLRGYASCAQFLPIVAAV